MTYIITILENIRKYDVYIGVNTHGIYFYLAMIGSPTTLTTSGQRYHNFGLSSSVHATSTKSYNMAEKTFNEYLDESNYASINRVVGYLSYKGFEMINPYSKNWWG